MLLINQKLMSLYYLSLTEDGLCKHLIPPLKKTPLSDRPSILPKYITAHIINAVLINKLP